MGLFGNQGVMGFITHLVSRFRRVVAEPDGAAPTTPGWALRLTIEPGASPRVEPAPAGSFP